ncbi:hypothetical protein GCM10027047_00510 [Rhodococcus aerolatus]
MSRVTGGALRARWVSSFSTQVSRAVMRSVLAVHRRAPADAVSRVRVSLTAAPLVPGQRVW